MDLYHANGLKQHRTSFENTIKKVKQDIISLEEDYIKAWEELNFYRKKWASIQESLIVIARNNKYKFSKSLDKCSNDEIILEINHLLEKTSNSEKEILKKYITEITDYYKKMEESKLKLENLSDILSKNHFKELDKDEEFVIDLDEYRQKKKKQSVIDNGCEVIAIYPANDDLISKVNNYLHKEEVQNVPFIEINDLLMDNEELNKYEKNTEEDFVKYKINGNLTLKDIASSVYGDQELWVYLYLYKTNKNILDSIAHKFDVPIEVIAGLKGFLDGVELKFPLDIFDYENTKKRIA